MGEESEDDEELPPRIIKEATYTAKVVDQLTKPDAPKEYRGNSILKPKK